MNKYYKIKAFVEMEQNPGLFSDSLGTIELNAIANKINFFEDDLYSNKIKSFKQRSYEIIKTGFPAIYYIRKQDIFCKIEISLNQLILYPLMPIFSRIGYGSEDAAIDLGKYIQIMIEISEQIPLRELITEENFHNI